MNLQEQVVAAAEGRLKRPEDALAFVDLDGLDADDPQSIKSAVDEVTRRRPYLAARGPLEDLQDPDAVVDRVREMRP